MRERSACSKALTWSALAALLALSACSMMFPHTEIAIQPEGATLDELGIALLADAERLVDAILYGFGVFGWF